MKTLRRGFTLIELLIVVAIIGILAVALVPTISDAPARARDAARRALVNSVVTAVESYNIDNGRYPATNNNDTVCLSAQGLPVDITTLIANNLKGEAPETSVVGTVPDPADADVVAQGCTDSVYYKPINNTSYRLGVMLEIANGTPSDGSDAVGQFFVINR